MPVHIFRHNLQTVSFVLTVMTLVLVTHDDDTGVEDDDADDDDLSADEDD